MIASQDVLEHTTHPRAAKTPAALWVLFFGAAVAAIGAVWWSMLGMSDPQTFEVLSQRGEVRVSGAAAAAQGAVVKTGSDGIAAVRLGDGTIINVMPGTELTVAAAGQSADGKRFRTSLELNVGEITSRVPTGDDRARELTLLSKSVAIGVRGTVFTVRADDQVSRLAVTQGKVQADANAGGRVMVPADYGTVIETGKSPSTPTRLPSPPAASLPLDSARVDGELRFAWRSAGEGVRTQLEIARDKFFNDIVVRKQANGDSVSVDPLPRDGGYFWRVASIDDKELRGQWSTVRSFTYKYYFAQGKTVLKALDVAKAIENFRHAEEGLKDELDFLRERGEQHLGAREYAQASAHFNVLLGLNGNDVLARYLLARTEHEQMNLGGARAGYEAVLALAPNDPLATVGLAQVEVREGKFTQALARLQPTLDAPAPNSAALVTAAMAAVGLGDKSQASAYIQRALDLDPENDNARAFQRSLERSLPILGALGRPGPSAR